MTQKVKFVNELFVADRVVKSADSIIGYNNGVEVSHSGECRIFLYLSSILNRKLLCLHRNNVLQHWKALCLQ